MATVAKWVAIGIVLFFVWASWQSCQDEPVAEKPSCDRFDMELAAEDHVRKQLVAPATADFNTSGPQALQWEGDTANYVNWVDSENRFGAKLRLYFKVWLVCRNGEPVVVDARYEGG